MKYVLTMVFGLIVGFGMALAGLYYNPLTNTEAPSPGGDDWR